MEEIYRSNPGQSRSAIHVHFTENPGLIHVNQEVLAIRVHFMENPV
jgi:hypothetical protein